ncbi:MAG: tetratricopeptide repeat protein [Planctomycetota bacterium]
MDEVRWIVGAPPPWWRRWRTPIVVFLGIGAALGVLFYCLIAQEREEKAEGAHAAAVSAHTEAQDLLKTAEAWADEGREVEASRMAGHALERAEEGLGWEPDHAGCIQDVDRALVLTQATDAERAALADRALERSRDVTEARLIQLRLLVEPLLDRWAIVSAGETKGQDRARNDPALANLRKLVLESSAVLLQRKLAAPDAEEVRALRAFAAGEQMPVGTGALVCSLWAFRAILDGDPRRGSHLVQPYGRERRWQGLAEWIHAHALIALQRTDGPFEKVPTIVLALLESLPVRFRSRASYWIDRAAAIEDPIEAEGDLSKALALCPGEPGLLALQAEIAERRGDRVRAAMLREKAQGALADPTPRLVAVAELAEERGDYTRAREAYDELCARFEVKPEVRLRRARFLLRTRAAKEALADAELVHAAQPSNDSLRLLADALTASGRPEEALKRAVGDAAALRSARSRALRALGRLEEAYDEATEVGDWAEAAACRLRMGRLDEAKALAERVESALAYDVLARVAFARGRFLEAKGWMESALRKDPFRASGHALQGLLHLREDRFGDATAALTKAVELDPACWEGWRGLAEMRCRQGNDTEALDALGRIPASDPRDASFYVLRARILARQGFARNAIEDLDEAIRLEGSSYFMILERAELKLAIEDWAGARTDAELARTKVARASEPWKLIALADLAEGKPEAAEKGFDEALRRNPKDVEARLARAALRLSRKDRAGAREDLSAAVEVDFGDADALYRLLRMDAEDGRWEEVREAAPRFATLHPKDERAAQARQWFEAAAAALR